jgi:hypothetical protein
MTTMRTSYDECLAELDRAGLNPAGQRRGAVRARRTQPFDIFAKSEPAVAPRTDHFSALVHELGTILDGRKHRAARVRAGRQHEQEFSKALRSLDAVRRTYLRPIIIRADALNKRPRPAETIAKAFAALQGGDLTPAQRGTLALRLSELTDRVERFSKANHPMLDRLDDVRQKLDAALASGHVGRAEPLIQAALKLIKSGRVESADHARLSLLLSEIRHEIEEAHSGSQN